MSEARVAAQTCEAGPTTIVADSWQPDAPQACRPEQCHDIWPGLVRPVLAEVDDLAVELFRAAAYRGFREFRLLELCCLCPMGAPRA